MAHWRREALAAASSAARHSGLLRQLRPLRAAGLRLGRPRLVPVRGTEQQALQQRREALDVGGARHPGQRLRAIDERIGDLLPVLHQAELLARREPEDRVVRGQAAEQMRGGAILEAAEAEVLRQPKDVAVDLVRAHIVRAPTETVHEIQQRPDSLSVGDALQLELRVAAGRLCGLRLLAAVLGNGRGRAGAALHLGQLLAQLRADSGQRYLVGRESLRPQHEEDVVELAFLVQSGDALREGTPPLARVVPRAREALNVDLQHERLETRAGQLRRRGGRSPMRHGGRPRAAASLRRAVWRCADGGAPRPLMASAA
mmetsp:Transcript_28620/g.86489  ORF Transcript_28620/g.86489 Transcript_28620/m.86489 type:complete len:315 (+) Transcript_28620:80-1024(+)